LTLEKTPIAGKSLQRQKLFDNHWNQWLDKLNKITKPELYASDLTIDETISETLLEIFKQHNPLVIKKLKQMPLANRGDALIFHVNPKEHLALTKALKNVLKFGQPDDKVIHEANLTTEIFLNKAGDTIEHAVNTLQDYDKNVVYDILMTLTTSVEQHNKTTKSYKFTPEFSVDIAIVVASFAARKLKVMVKNLKIQNDPVNSLTKLKPIFLGILSLNLQLLQMIKQLQIILVLF